MMYSNLILEKEAGPLKGSAVQALALVTVTVFGVKRHTMVLKLDLAAPA